MHCCARRRQSPPGMSGSQQGPNSARLSPSSQRPWHALATVLGDEAEKTDAHLSRRYWNGVWPDRNVGGLGAVRGVSSGNEPTVARAYGQGPCGVASLGSLPFAFCSDCGRKYAFDDDQARRCFVCQCIADLTRGRVSTMGELSQH
jgi:hypothetical protein